MTKYIINFDIHRDQRGQDMLYVDDLNLPQEYRDAWREGLFNRFGLLRGEIGSEEAFYVGVPVLLTFDGPDALFDNVASELEEAAYHFFSKEFATDAPTGHRFRAKRVVGGTADTFE